MMNSWKEWEGRTVDGKFLLGNYLGGSEGSAVFRTRVGNGRAPNEGVAEDAAIKLIALDGAEAESQLRQWKTASELSHPNLIRILTVGRAAVEDWEDGRELVYAVEEVAEENLAQILPERALTAEEARGMLGPVLAALEFVHGKGLVHGRIRPSNILAAGDQVKLSSDSLRRAGEVPRTEISRTEISRTTSAYDAPEVPAAGISPASDVWSLGITLVEVLTQRVPVWDPARMSAPDVGGSVPEPFRGIAQGCLQVDPAKRCGLREIATRLEGRLAAKPAAPAPSAAPVESIAVAQKKTAKGPYLLVLAAALVVVIFLIVRPWPSSVPGEVQTAPALPQTSSSQTISSQTGHPAPVEPPPAQSPSIAVQPAPAQTTSAAGTPPAQEQAKPPALGAAGAGTNVAAEPGGDQKTVAKDEIVQRAMPQVSPGAQRTIHGKIKVRVTVEVDAAGNVTEARLKESGSSSYFARAALEAARRWKFAPAHDENLRDWTLFFAFTRGRTEMSADRAR
jgi:TonB family protein